MAKLLLENGKSVKLKKGEYDSCELKNLCLTHEKIKQISLCPCTDIKIIPCKDKGKERIYENDTCKKDTKDVCVKLCECPFIKVSSCEETWDYIIIGLGSAGSILAEKLSRDNKTRVLVIEAGVNHQDDPVVKSPNWVPFASKLAYNPEYSVVYPITYDPNQPFSILPYTEGRLWGGSSAHNFLVAVRGTPEVYDGWASTTDNDMWLYENMLPLMKRLETYTPNGTPIDLLQRGTEGPIKITQSPPLDKNNLLLKAYETVTLSPFVPDYDVPSASTGISSNQQSITSPFDGVNSVRSYSNVEFLPVGVVIDEKGNGLNGRKLKILSNSQVFRFNIHNKKARSVTYIENNECNRVLCAHLKRKGQLILAAGSVSSPSILLRSGVGPKDELEKLGIPVVVDSPNVGKNLQNHYGTGFISRGDMQPNFPQVYMDLYPYYPNDSKRRIQNFNIRLPDDPVLGPIFEALPSIMSPKSRGSVTLVSSNPLFYPKVDIGVFTDGDGPGSDLDQQITFFEIMKQVVIESGGNDSDILFPTEQQYNFGLLKQAALDSSYLLLGDHIVGTTRMGKTIDDGVVDGYLKVHGLKNVRVGDIGIQPETVTGNTCLSAYYIALVLCKILGVNL